MLIHGATKSRELSVYLFVDLSIIIDNPIQESIKNDMYTVLMTDEFDEWLEGLKDLKAKGIVSDRLVRMESGLFGDAKSVGGGVSELRIDFGPGYRVYYTKTGRWIVILLWGGDKSSQKKDIKTAQAMTKGLDKG